jgi:broad specificity phosphatase PhoE
MAVDLIYETHATTVDNENGIATGWLPGELSERGRREAHDLGFRRRAESIDAVFVSDLRRAIQTADIAFAGCEIPILRDPRLRECNYGELNGKPVKELAAVRRYHIDVPFPGGQSYRQVVDETRTFLNDLASKWDGHRVVIIAHSANRWALDHLLIGTPIESLVDAPFNWQPGWRYRLQCEA